MPNRSGTPENLREPWKPGQSGNPSGRPKGALSPVEHLRALSGAKWTVGELEALLDDPDVPAVRKAAARTLLQAAEGTSPGDQRAAFSEVADRLDGKPTQSHTVEARQALTPAQALAMARAELVGSRRERKALAEPQAQQAQTVSVRVVDGQAVEGVSHGEEEAGE